MNLTALAEISIKTCLQNVRQGYGFLLLRTAETGGIKTDEKQQPMIMAENGPESSADFEFAEYFKTYGCYGFFCFFLN